MEHLIPDSLKRWAMTTESTPPLTASSTSSPDL
jgi:hypothetical protein